jgi:8-oxo-dGTP diphosphatase
MVEVVVGALVRDGRVLLAHRRPDKAAYPDTWDLPGGVMEEGESELDALVRELREELGVEIDVDAVTHLCSVEARPVREPVVLSAWLVREWRGTPANLAPEEHLDLGWFGLDDLPPPANNDVRAALVEALGG